MNRQPIYLLLAVALVLPLALFGALQGAFLMRAAQSRVESDAAYRARAVNAAVDGVVKADQTALEVLASSQFLADRDFAGALARVSGVQARRPRWKAVYLTDVATRRVIWESGNPSSAGKVAPAWIAPPHAAFRPIGNIVRDGEGCPCLPIQTEVREAGQVRYVLSAEIGTADFQAALMAQTPSDTVSAIVDREGRFIARSVDYENRVGHLATKYVRGAISQEKSGLYPGVTYEGFRNYTAFETSELTGWSTHIAVSEALLKGPRRASLLLTLAAAASAISLALVLSIFVWRQFELGRRQAARVAESDKLTAIGELASGLSHDLNNLLTVIMTSVEFLKRGDLEVNRRTRYIDAISEAASRAAALTNQLLAFARRQPLHPRVFDVGEHLRRAEALIRPMVGVGVQVEIALPARPCFALADPDQFQAALLNLCKNARDAMDGHGRLDLKVTAVAAIPATRGQQARLGDFIEISVKDTGVGIEASQLDRIFEPFITSKPVGKGTGLGLSQVLGFAQQSAGEVIVESRSGEGACFSVFLPAAAQPASHPPVKPVAASIRRVPGALRILLVEDDDTVGQFSTELLHDLGLKTTWVADADEATSILSTNAAHFDLVITDVIMPGRTGVELAKEIERNHPGLPVLLASGYTGANTIAGLGGRRLLKKPYSMEELLAAIRETLGAATLRNRS